MTTGMDPYGVLGVSPDASIDEIRIAYWHRMRALHPDRGGADDVVTHGEIAAVTEAWRQLIGDLCGPFALGSVEAPLEGREAGVDAPDEATCDPASDDDGPAPGMLRPVLRSLLSWCWRGWLSSS